MTSLEVQKLLDEDVTQSTVELAKHLNIDHFSKVCECSREGSVS